MPFKKGQSGNKNGRPKGRQSKTTLSVKEALQAAFEGIGGIPSLIAWARYPQNQGEFYKLYAKLLPKELEVMGVDGGPIQSKVEVVFVNSAHTG
jgi:hypothetical protein